MYDLMDAEFDWVAVYFVFAIVFCTFFVVNLSVSVICAIYCREWSAYEETLKVKNAAKYREKCVMGWR